MIAVTLYCIGSLKEKYWREACGEYEKRLGRFCRFSCVELEEYRRPAEPSPAQIQQGLEEECKRILSRISPKETVAALCIEGKKLTSPQLGSLLEEQAMTGPLALVIGGSYGLSPQVKERARLRLSMSDMTFPHQLARVMLLEQLYRGFMIPSGGKYHK